MPENEQAPDQHLEQNAAISDVSGTPLPTDESILQSSTDVDAVEITPRRIAPIWHTVLLVVAILGYSVWGAIGAKSHVNNPLTPTHSVTTSDTAGTDHIRIIRYALTAGLELIIVAWVAFGLRLRNVPFRSLFGKLPRGLNDITKEAAIAAGFWVCSMVILLICALGWLTVQNLIYKDQASNKSAQSSSASESKSQAPKSPEQKQTEMVRQLMELAPANGFEIAAWGLVCLIVGFSEELIFRGYLQTQSIQLLRNIPISVVLTAIIFGSAHGYQGLRGIFLITIFGSLFGILTLMRKNLFPGMLAHAWHDFATGIALAIIRATHLLDHLPPAPK
jgi:membrane protease YdiL (CAAX protease family)